MKFVRTFQRILKLRAILLLFLAKPTFTELMNISFFQTMFVCKLWVLEGDLNQHYFDLSLFDSEEKNIQTRVPELFLVLAILKILGCNKGLTNILGNYKNFCDEILVTIQNGCTEMLDLISIQKRIQTKQKKQSYFGN